MSKEHKAVPCSPSALIQLDGSSRSMTGASSFRNFASMRDANDLTMLEMKAPPWHRQITNAIKAAGKVRGEDIMNESFKPVRLETRRELKYKTGATAKDKKQGKRVTIIQAAAGHTKKSHTPVHRVADRHGNSWLAKETDLTLIF